MRALKHPAIQFLAVALVTLIAIVISTGRLSSTAAEHEAIADARMITEVLAHSVAEPAIPEGLVDLDPGAIDRLDRFVLGRLKVQKVERIKIWSADGRVLYSDETDLIGEQYPLGRDEKEVLAGAPTDAEVLNLTRDENRFERGKGGLLEVYTRIDSPEGEPLLFEVYFSDTDIEERSAAIFSSFRPITLGALGVLLAVATPLLFLLTRRLARAGEERERLLRAAVAASDAERIRIARDLHDGVVQDLAGTAFAVSALGRAEALPPETRRGLRETGLALRSALRQLRSLMVEIYPPDLHTAGLAAALQDLLAPAEASGLHVSLTVDDVKDVPDEVVALVWRVAQEAVRNALRHADASALEVSVRRVDDSHVLLQVKDDGRGFDQSVTVGPGHFGLRGLASLAADAGGRLQVLSSVGKGTAVTLEVAAA